jgi:hypothetical protein
MQNNFEYVLIVFAPDSKDEHLYYETSPVPFPRFEKLDVITSLDHRDKDEKSELKLGITKVEYKLSKSKKDDLTFSIFTEVYTVDASTWLLS